MAPNVFDEEFLSALYFNSKFKTTSSTHTYKIQGVKFFIIEYVWRQLCKVTNNFYCSLGQTSPRFRSLIFLQGSRDILIYLDISVCQNELGQLFCKSEAEAHPAKTKEKLDMREIFHCLLISHPTRCPKNISIVYIWLNSKRIKFSGHPVS